MQRSLALPTVAPTLGSIPSPFCAISDPPGVLPGRGKNARRNDLELALLFRAGFQIAEGIVRLVVVVLFAALSAAPARASVVVSVLGGVTGQECRSGPLCGW